MRTVNFDDLDDEEGTEPLVRPAAAPAASAEMPTTLGTRTRTQDELLALSGLPPGYGTDAAPKEATAFDLAGDPHEALTFGELTGDGTGEALDPVPDDAYAPGAQELPVDDSRSIHAMHAALQSPSKSLGEAVQVVLENYGRLTPSQVEALHGVLLELGADLDADAEAGGRYGPDFDMTAFIQRMLRTTRSIENRLYTPGEDGMRAAFTAQELGAITNANKNLMTLIAKNHDRVMGWERQRAIEAAHMAAARDLPADIQDRYLAKLQAELEARGL